MTATAANAGGLVSKHTSSVQLTVDAAEQPLLELVLHSAYPVVTLLPPMEQQQELFLLKVLLLLEYMVKVQFQSKVLMKRTFSFSRSYTQADAVPSAAVSLGST